MKKSACHRLGGIKTTGWRIDPATTTTFGFPSCPKRNPKPKMRDRGSNHWEKGEEEGGREGVIGGGVIASSSFIFSPFSTMVPAWFLDVVFTSLICNYI